jgi:O-antigen ligase
MLTAATARLPRRAAPRVSAARPGPLADYYRIPAVVRWSFIGFIGTMPLEAADLPITSSTFSVARLAGLAFFASYIFFYNPLSGKRSLPPLPAALSWFLVYLLIFAANGVFLDAVYFRQFVSIFLTLAQLMLLFWIASSLLRVETLARRALIAFAAGAVICAAGTLVGLPGFATVITSRFGERVTALDFNPNYLAYTMAVAAVILIDTGLEAKPRFGWMKGLWIAPVLPLLALMVRTGSRTGVAAFAIGFIACMLPNRKSRRRLIVIFLSVVVVASLIYLVLQHPTVLSRFEQSYQGNLAGRQNIIPASVDMILQQPVLGWQPVAYWEELARRVGQVWGVRDAHNLVFHLLLEVGFLGAVPFLIGLWLCVIGAWKARAGKFGNLPFALLAMTLSANLTHTYLGRKPQWLILAFAAAAAATAVQRSAAARYLIRHPLRSSARAAGNLFPANARQRQF